MKYFGAQCNPGIYGERKRNGEEELHYCQGSEVRKKQRLRKKGGKNFSKWVVCGIGYLGEKKGRVAPRE